MLYTEHFTAINRKVCDSQCQAFLNSLYDLIQVTSVEHLSQS